MMMSALAADHRYGREVYPTEDYALWSWIEDLGTACGYAPAEQFSLLSGLPDAYPVLSGQDPYEIAVDHPMQALAMLVRRFLTEYPEAAERMMAAEEPAVPAVQPGKAA